MNDPMNSSLNRLYRDDSGQVLPWMAFLMVLFCGMAGITIDLGHAYVCYRELQSSTDAAALAGAYAMTLSGATTASVTSQVDATSSLSNSSNANPNLKSVTVTPTFRCVMDSSIIQAPCSASPTGSNVLQVVQTSVVPTYFIRVLGVFGIKAAQSIPINAMATATPLSGKNTQVNVAMVVDTTASMGTQDSDVNCNNTRIHCALNGVQTLLGQLTPCTASSTKTNCTGFDQVSLFTFPNVIASTASNDTTCPSGNPSAVPYSTPTPGAPWSAPKGASATYQISDYLSDYSSNNQKGGSLNTSSSLAIATGASGSQNCNGMQTPGGEGTYYAGVIYAAQSSLASASAANPGSENIMIILSDGDANSTKISGGQHSGNVYGSLDDQCQQAISAAQYATGQGTTVYTIAYGASSSGCSSDKSGPLAGLSPCTAMQGMASAPGDFYSDATASQNKGQCASGNSFSLDSIFTSIAAKFTNARLVPNGIV
ncbi:MAG TPA: pilus assembly protein TadG-related protein [Terracidiphilus sp.]|nr:pilus assembly protein TadG-related protein [Terracidiphilus sp.]